jgi:hypothetical protein
MKVYIEVFIPCSWYFSLVMMLNSLNAFPLSNVFMKTSNKRIFVNEFFMIDGWLSKPLHTQIHTIN